MDDGHQTDHDRSGGLAGRLAPVGRRLLGRQARLLRATGRGLSETVAGRHETPEPAKAARRLAPVRLVTRTPAAPAAPAPVAGPASGWEPSASESTVLPGISDWAAEFMFGDEDSAVSAASPWVGGADIKPRTPEQKRLSRIKRGGPEVARGAKILEGDEAMPPAAPSPGGRGSIPEQVGGPPANVARTPAAPGGARGSAGASSLAESAGAGGPPGRAESSGPAGESEPAGPSGSSAPGDSSGPAGIRAASPGPARVARSPAPAGPSGPAGPSAPGESSGPAGTRAASPGPARVARSPAPAGPSGSAGPSARGDSAGAAGTSGGADPAPPAGSAGPGDSPARQRISRLPAEPFDGDDAAVAPPADSILARTPLPRVRLDRSTPPAPARPVVQRAAVPVPEPEPAPAEAEPRGLFRRVVDSLRGSAPELPTALAPSAAPRAKITRVVAPAEPPSELPLVDTGPDEPAIDDELETADESIARMPLDDSSGGAAGPVDGAPGRPTVARTARDDDSAGGPTGARDGDPSGRGDDSPSGEAGRPIVARTGRDDEPGRGDTLATGPGRLDSPMRGELDPGRVPTARGDDSSGRPSVARTAHGDDPPTGATGRPTVARTATDDDSSGRPTVARAASGDDSPAATGRPTVARTPRGDDDPPTGASGRPTVARTPHGDDTPPSATGRPTVARTARGDDPPTGSGRPTVARTARGDDPPTGSGRPTVARTARGDDSARGAGSAARGDAGARRTGSPGRPAVARTARAANRPPGGAAAAVARRPRVALQDAPPEQPVSEARVPTGTSAARLARALGTEVGVDENGNASVELPAPGGQPFVPFSTAPRTVTRLIDDPPSPGPGPAPAPAPGGAAQQDGTPGAPELDVDKIAETVIDKLRRELLIEREQSGGSMDLI